MLTLFIRHIAFILSVPINSEGLTAAARLALFERNFVTRYFNMRFWQGRSSRGSLGVLGRAE